MQLEQMSALELGEEIAAGRVTIPEVVSATFSEIRSREESLHCFLTLAEQSARQQAVRLQAIVESENPFEKPEEGLLVGVPFAVKDNLCTKGLRTTCGSAMLEHFVPTYSAGVVNLLEKAGAVLVGKTNMDEFAFGSTTETSCFGPTRNPIDPERVPGGSSGGSAAAVAAGECGFAIGTDTGGSIRQPAAYCGVVGLKPTYGLVSRYGLIAYASSMDQAGPLTRDVRDCAAVLQVIAKKDGLDSTSVETEPKDYLKACVGDVRGLRIGLADGAPDTKLQPEVAGALERAGDCLREAGAEVERVQLPYLEYMVPAYYTLACAEASSNLERFDGVKYGYRDKTARNLSDLYERSRTEAFGPEVKRRILLGTYVLSAGFYDQYYLKALKARRKIKEAYDSLYTQYDLILCPTAPTTAPKFGAYSGDTLAMYQSDLFTVPANLTGCPAISVPFGEDADGLPIGLQLMGRAFEEPLLFQGAALLETERKGGRSV